MMGQMLGSNPTHQLNLHFYHIFRWMQQVNYLVMAAMQIRNYGVALCASKSVDWHPTAFTELLCSYGLASPG